MNNSSEASLGEPPAAKQLQSLKEHFEKPMFIVFLRGKQKVAPDRWVNRYCKIVEKDLHIANKKVKVNVLKLQFEAPNDLRAPGGGQFTIEGDSFGKTRVCCLSQLNKPKEASMIPIVPYSDDESLVSENASDEDEEQEANQMQPPDGVEMQHHEDPCSEGEVSEAEESDLGDEDEGWERGPTCPVASKEKKFHVSDEYMLLQQEGLMDLLPNLHNAGLGRHTAGAWSAHYPDETGGLNYVSRR